MARVEDRLRKTKAALCTLLRPRRDCSMSMYLLLLELYAEGELSALAIERRLKLVGIMNPRQLFPEGRAQRWIVCEADEEGKRWRLTGEGQAVVAGLLRRMQLAEEMQENGSVE